MLTAKRVESYLDWKTAMNDPVTTPDIKIKYWWSHDAKWFCVLANDGTTQVTISLTPEEACLLSGNAWPPPPDCDDYADASEGERSDAWDEKHPSDRDPPRTNVNECPACHHMFKDGETCGMGGCPMGGDV